MRTRIRSFLGAGVLGLLLAPTAWTQADVSAHRERVRARYAAAAWPRGAVRDGLPIALEIEGWSAGVLRRADRVLTRSFTRAGTRAEQPSFVLEFVVADSVDGSHAELLTWLAGLQSSERIPSASELGFEVGDIAFVGRSGASPGAVAWIAFARGNVAVRVSAFDARREPELDLAQVAGRIDAAVVARAALPAGARPARPRVDVLVAERSAVVAGERVRLNLVVTDAARGQPFVEWHVGGTGQGYVERAADGLTYLHTSGPGPLTVTAAVTASTGTLAERSIEIEVTEER